MSSCTVEHPSVGVSSSSRPMPFLWRTPSEPFSLYEYPPLNIRKRKRIKFHGGNMSHSAKSSNQSNHTKGFKNTVAGTDEAEKPAISVVCIRFYSEHPGKAVKATQRISFLGRKCLLGVGPRVVERGRLLLTAHRNFFSPPKSQMCPPV